MKPFKKRNGCYWQNNFVSSHCMDSLKNVLINFGRTMNKTNIIFAFYIPCLLKINHF